jgi:acyl dehydratase
MTIAWPDIVDPKTRDIDFGPGAWRTVTGEQVDLFARATGDLQFVHLDPERAKLEGPFGGAVAHGFLLLSLMPVLLAERIVLPPEASVVNYGLGNLRFATAVRVGERIRGRFVLVGRNRIEASKTILKIRSTIEVENGRRPAVVADPLIVLVQFITRHNMADLRQSADPVSE